MATIWTGSIQFGLVEIPIALRSAERRDELASTLLDRRSLAPVGYRHYNKNTGREVEWKEIVHGFEVEDGRYVVLSDEELKAADPEATRTVEIVEFVESCEIEPLYFERPYYLEPRRKASKSYALLREVLRRTRMVGIATLVLRSRQYVAVLHVHGPALALTLLRYAHELRDPGELELPGEAGLRPAELRMAEELVRSMAGKWKPQEFHDTYRDKVLALVRQKAKTGRVKTVETPRPRAEPKVIDLMAMLKQSVAEKRRRPAARARRTPRSRQRSA